MITVNTLIKLSQYSVSPYMRTPIKLTQKRAMMMMSEEAQIGKYGFQN